MTTYAKAEDMQKLVDGIVECKAIMQRPFGGDPRTRPSYDISVNQARERMSKLETDLREKVKDVSIMVCVSGAAAPDLKEVLKSKGAIVVDVNDFTKPIGDSLEASFGGDPRRSFTVNSAVAIFSVLQQLLIDLGVVDVLGAGVPGHLIGRDLTDRAVIDRTVREIVKEICGVDAFAAYINKRSLDVAVDAKNISSFYPVFVFGLAANEEAAVSRNLFGARYTTITINDPKKARDERAFPKVLAASAKAFAEFLPEQVRKTFLDSLS